MKFFLPIIFKSYPIMIFLILFVSVLQAGQSVLWIIMPKEIIEELTGDKNIQNLVTLVLVFVITNFIIAIINNITFSLIDYYSRKTDFYVDKMINDKIMSVDYFLLENPEFKDLVSRAQKGMYAYSYGVFGVIISFREMLTYALTILSVTGIVIYSKQYLVFLIVAIGIIVNTLINKKGLKIEKKFNDLFIRNGRRMNYYNRSVFNRQAQKELRIYDCKDMILSTCKNENQKAFGQYKMNARKNQFLWSFESFFAIFFTDFLSMILLVYAAIQGKITIATLTMLLSSITELSRNIFGFIRTAQEYVQSCSYQDAFIDLMEFKSVFKSGNLPLEELESIEFKNVYFKYPGTDHYILEDVSFKLENKQKVSLVGLNGSGKTTIIKLLCRFYPIESGKILINGIPIEEYHYQEYMKQLAVVFQDYYIISYTIKSNIAICDENQDKLYDCLKRAQALDLVLGLEMKENTYVNKWFNRNGVEFSGGERQKFAIARALYKDSDFVVMDEPTSSLDPQAEAEIYYHFNDIVGKKLTLFISHRLSSCIFSDRIIVLDGNKIVEEGTHKELMKKKDSLYYKMFTTQAKYYK